MPPSKEVAGEALESMFRSGRRNVAVASVITTVLVGSAVATVALAPTSLAAEKGYTAAFQSTGTAAGTTTSLRLLLTNTSDNRIAFGSANVTVPSELTVVGTPTINTNRGRVALSRGVIQLRDLNVQRGASVAVSFSVAVDCTDAGTSTWTTAVKQSNDFLGTGNDFALDQVAPAATTVSGACRLAFSGQPTDARIGTVITATGGQPVSVQVLDGRTTGAQRVIAFTGPITLGLSGTGDGVAPAPVLSGGGAVPAVAGLASFGPSIDERGTYQLTASSPGLTSATSSSFVVGGPLTINCRAGDSQACTTGPFSSTGGTIGNITLNDGDGVTGTIVGDFDGRTFQCAEYTATSDALVFDVTSSQSLSGLTKTIVLQQQAVAGKAAGDYQVCFEAPYEFPAFLPSQLVQDFSLFDFDGNTTTAVVDGQTVHRGLLLPCDAGLGVPCVASRVVEGGVATVTFTTAAADPAGRF